MLTIAPEKIAYIIEKARVFDEEMPSDGTDAGSNPADDGGAAILLDTAGNPTLLELRGFIEDLNIDEQEDLLALIWIGRGDFAAEDWNAALAQARAVRTDDEADYLIGTPLLADYLSEGLAALGVLLDETLLDSD